MIKEYLMLRNRLHAKNFRFNLPTDLWAAHYLPDPNMEARHIVRVEKDGVLEGYAVYTLLADENIRAYKILEICASSREVLKQLIDHIINRSVRDEIDFVFVRKNEEPLDRMLGEKKFVSFVDCVIMSALLNPRELLMSMSENIDDGEVLELKIKGFDSIYVRTRNGKMKVVDKEKPNVVVKIDSKTFLELLFGKSSFYKELLKRKVIINSLLRISTVVHFFGAIKQERPYIPQGEWT